MEGDPRKSHTLLTILLFTLWLASCARTSDEQRDRAFEQMIGPIFDGTLLLHTDKERYTGDDSVAMWIENNTGATLYFPDQSFGVQGFRYSESDKQWEPYRLFGGVGNPARKKVEPGAWRWEEVYYYLPTYLMNIDGERTVRIRLLVIGYSEPLEVGGGQRHGAYTDIEVSAQSVP